MIVEQIWTDNACRNFNYLIACRETGEALAIDPVAHKLCLQRAKDMGWEISQILNTHEHRDHILGNSPLKRATGAPLLAHHDAGSSIPGIDQGLSDGDIVRVGRTVELLVLDTPGHTLSHLCLLSKSDNPVLISGDTIFAAGVGNCRGGGDAEVLFQTFETKFAQLSGDTRIYPGHNYLVNNLKFTLDREPGNERATALLSEAIEADEAGVPIVTTWSLEQEINTFLRLESKEIQDRLRESSPELSGNPTPKEVFLKLRALRDRW